MVGRLIRHDAACAGGTGARHAVDWGLGVRERLSIRTVDVLLVYDIHNTLYDNKKHGK